MTGPWFLDLRVWGRPGRRQHLRQPLVGGRAGNGRRGHWGESWGCPGLSFPGWNVRCRGRLSGPPPLPQPPTSPRPRQTHDPKSCQVLVARKCARRVVVVMNTRGPWEAYTNNTEMHSHTQKLAQIFPHEDTHTKTQAGIQVHNPTEMHIQTHFQTQKNNQTHTHTHIITQAYRDTERPDAHKATFAHTADAHRHSDHTETDSTRGSSQPHTNAHTQAQRHAHTDPFRQTPAMLEHFLLLPGPGGNAALVGHSPSHMWPACRHGLENCLPQEETVLKPQPGACRPSAWPGGWCMG